MLCEHCKCKVKKGDKYCAGCGKKIHIKNEAVDKRSLTSNMKIYFSSCKKYFKENKNIIRIKGTIIKNKIKLLFSVLIILLLAIIYNIISYINSPIFIANNYFKTIVDNDYNKIMDYINTNDSDLVNKDMLEDKMVKLGNVTDYKVIRTEVYDNEALVTYSYTSNNKNYVASVLLKKSSNNNMIFFDNWIVESGKLARNITFIVPKDSKITVDNIDITSYLDSSNTYYDTYIIDEMIKGTYNIKIDLIDGISVDSKVDISTDEVYNIGNVDINSDLETSLSGKANTLLGQIYNGIIQNISYDNLNLGTTDLKREYNNLKNSIINKNYDLKSLNFTDIELYSASYDNQANLVGDFIVNYDYNLEYTYNGQLTTYSGSNQTTIRVTFEFNNDEYNINNISSLISNFKIN